MSVNRGKYIIDGNRVFQKFQQHKISAEFQTALLMALENSRDGTLSWKEYRIIKDQHNITWDDFIAIILQNRLIWILQPFVFEQRASVSSKDLNSRAYYDKLLSLTIGISLLRGLT